MITKDLLLCGFLVLLISGCGRVEEQQCEGPWIIMDTEETTRTDLDALHKWMRREACGFVRFGTVGYDVRITLDGDKDAVPHCELMRIAAEARTRLPPGCPITIGVETIGSAIAHREEAIAKWQDEIVRLRRGYICDICDPINEEE